MIAKCTAILALLALPLSISLWHQSSANPQQRRYDVTLYKSLRVSLVEGVCGLRLLSMPTKVASRTEFFSPISTNPIPNPGSLQLSTRISSRGNRIIWLVFPLWLPTVLLTLITLIPVVTGPVRRWRRKRTGCCIYCGYQLQGNRTGRCPECGTRFRASFRADGRRAF